MCGNGQKRKKAHPATPEQDRFSLLSVFLLGVTTGPLKAGVLSGTASDT